MALEDHRAIETGAFDRLPIHDHRSIRWRVKAGENVQHRRLAATGMADHADEFAARHRQPEVFEHRRRAAARRWKSPCNAFYGDETVRHGSLGKRDETREPRKDEVKQHAD